MTWCSGAASSRSRYTSGGTFASRSAPVRSRHSMETAPDSWSSLISSEKPVNRTVSGLHRTQAVLLAAAPRSWFVMPAA